MHIPQLLSGTLVLALAGASACSREDTRQNARDAAANTRVAAARAGEQLADSWLTTKIQAQYFADDDIKARYVNVSTDDGMVTLTGYVDDQQSREQAVQIAKNTDGVRQVNDSLTIGPAPGNVFESAGVPPSRETGTPTGAVPTTGEEPPAAVPAGDVPVDDASITTRIQAKYFLDGAVKRRRIDVDAQSGVVTLRGEVASEAERAQALLLARGTEGVQRVEDNLTVDASIAGEAEPQAPAPAIPDAGSGTPDVERHDAPPEP